MIKQEIARKIQRAAGCGALIALMGICTWLGGESGDKVSLVSLPVTRTQIGAYDDMESACGGMDAVVERLASSREREIALLDEVIASHADPQTVAYAAEQKTAIAERMETEALACAALGALGYTECAACCAGGMLAVFLPENMLSKEEQTASLIDAVSEQTGMAGESIKIILAKNET